MTRVYRRILNEVIKFFMLTIAIFYILRLIGLHDTYLYTPLAEIFLILGLTAGYIYTVPKSSKPSLPEQPDNETPEQPDTTK